MTQSLTDNYNGFNLICGIPNAGKTTYSSKYENVIHTDEIKKTRLVCDMVSNAGDNVCVEGIWISAHIRKELLRSYKGNGKKVCVWLNTPYEECVKREDRGRGTLIIQNCHELFEPPTYEEGWDEIIIIE